MKSVTSYLNFQTFLKDFYEYKKSTIVGFSYTVWANACGIKSRSYLRLIVQGKRTLTPITTEKLLPYFDFTPKEKIHFRYLIEFNNVNTIEEKEILFRKIQKNKATKKHLVENIYDYLSHPWMPFIAEILEDTSLDRSVESLVKVTNLPTQEVKKILKHLSSMGYATCEEGQWTSKYKDIKIPDQLNHMAIQKFHRNSLESAIQTLSLDSNKRFFHSTFLTMDEESYNILSQEIKDFSIYILNEIKQKSKSSNKKLFQINFNIIPKTDELIPQNSCEPGPVSILNKELL